MKKKQFLISAFMMLSSTIALAQNESDFYTPQTGGVTKNLVTDYGVDNKFTTDDSPKLQTAIDAVSAAGGGKIVIPLGNYSFAEINLKSNVRLEIDKGAVIRPTNRPNQNNYAIFNIGDAATINNVSISGIGGSFTVDISLTAYKNVRVISCNNVNNFQIAYINILDNNTKFAAITFGFALYNGTYYGPQNGVVKNANIEKAQWGYGLIQTQVGNHILFKNLSGNGGSTLRLETGFTELNQLQILGLYDIFGRNISVKNGNAAVQVSPHCMKNGKFDIDTVSAINSGFAVLIASGYQRSTETNLQPGYFDSTSVINHVTATYGTTAQLKAKHFGYVPCALRSLISPTFNPDGESQAGPAIVAILDIAGSGTGPGYYKTILTNVSQTGFNYQPKTVLGESDFVQTCPSAPTTMVAPVSQNILSPNSHEGFNVSPNPTSDVVNVKCPVGSTVNIYSVSGNVSVKSLLTTLNISSINISDLPKGIYFVRIASGTEVHVKKLLIN